MKPDICSLMTTISPASLLICLYGVQEYMQIESSALLQCKLYFDCTCTMSPYAVINSYVEETLPCTFCLLYGCWVQMVNWSQFKIWQCQLAVVLNFGRNFFKCTNAQWCHILPSTGVEKINSTLFSVHKTIYFWISDNSAQITDHKLRNRRLWSIF